MKKNQFNDRIICANKLELFKKMSEKLNLSMNNLNFPKLQQDIGATPGQDRAGQVMERTLSQSALSNTFIPTQGGRLKTSLESLKAQLEDYALKPESSKHKKILSTAWSLMNYSLEKEKPKINALDKQPIQDLSVSILELFKTFSEKEGIVMPISGEAFDTIKRRLLEIRDKICDGGQAPLHDKEEGKRAQASDSKKSIESPFETNYFEMAAEFSKLKPCGNLKAVTYKAAQENRNRNRYPNILPYDHSRFRLNPDDPNDSFYYNASVIRKGWAIAAQGPKENEHQQFWEMVIASKVPAIVMLTNLKDKGVEKCSKYWPEKGETKNLKGMVIVCTDSKVLDYKGPANERIVLREFEIKDEKGTILHVVSHRHLENWPDFGTVDFHALEHLVIDTIGVKGPLLVHCSAGVGRTGTFLTIAAVYDEFGQGKAVSKALIKETVTELRQDRMGLVQTDEQYEIIHQACNALYEGNFKANEFLQQSDACTKATSKISYRADGALLF